MRTRLSPERIAAGHWVVQSCLLPLRGVGGMERHGAGYLREASDAGRRVARLRLCQCHSQRSEAQGDAQERAGKQLTGVHDAPVGLKRISDRAVVVVRLRGLARHDSVTTRKADVRVT